MDLRSDEAAVTSRVSRRSFCPELNSNVAHRIAKWDRSSRLTSNHNTTIGKSSRWAESRIQRITRRCNARQNLRHFVSPKFYWPTQAKRDLSSNAGSRRPQRSSSARSSARSDGSRCDSSTLADAYTGSIHSKDQNSVQCNGIRKDEDSNESRRMNRKLHNTTATKKQNRHTLKEKVSLSAQGLPSEVPQTACLLTTDQTINDVAVQAGLPRFGAGRKRKAMAPVEGRPAGTNKKLKKTRDTYVRPKPAVVQLEMPRFGADRKRKAMAPVEGQSPGTKKKLKLTGDTRARPRSRRAIEFEDFELEIEGALSSNEPHKQRSPVEPLLPQARGGSRSEINAQQRKTANDVTDPAVTCLSEMDLRQQRRDRRDQRRLSHVHPIPRSKARARARSPALPAELSLVVIPDKKQTNQGDFYGETLRATWLANNQWKFQPLLSRRAMFNVPVLISSNTIPSPRMIRGDDTTSLLQRCRTNVSRVIDSSRDSPTATEHGKTTTIERDDLARKSVALTRLETPPPKLLVRNGSDQARGEDMISGNRGKKRKRLSQSGLSGVPLAQPSKRQAWNVDPPILGNTDPKLRRQNPGKPASTMASDGSTATGDSAAYNSRGIKRKRGVKRKRVRRSKQMCRHINKKRKFKNEDGAEITPNATGLYHAAPPQKGHNTLRSSNRTERGGSHGESTLWTDLQGSCNNGQDSSARPGLSSTHRATWFDRNGRVRATPDDHLSPQESRPECPEISRSGCTRIPSNGYPPPRKCHSANPKADSHQHQQCNIEMTDAPAVRPCISVIDTNQSVDDLPQSVPQVSAVADEKKSTTSTEHVHDIRDAKSFQKSRRSVSSYPSSSGFSKKDSCSGRARRKDNIKTSMPAHKWPTQVNRHFLDERCNDDGVNTLQVRGDSVPRRRSSAFMDNEFFRGSQRPLRRARYHLEVKTLPTKWRDMEFHPPQKVTQSQETESFTWSSKSDVRKEENVTTERTSTLTGGAQISQLRGDTTHPRAQPHGATESVSMQDGASLPATLSIDRNVPIPDVEAARTLSGSDASTIGSCRSARPTSGTELKTSQAPARNAPKSSDQSCVRHKEEEHEAFRSVIVDEKSEASQDSVTVVLTGIPSALSVEEATDDPTATQKDPLFWFLLGRATYVLPWTAPRTSCEIVRWTGDRALLTPEDCINVSSQAMTPFTDLKEGDHVFWTPWDVKELSRNQKYRGLATQKHAKVKIHLGVFTWFTEGSPCVKQKKFACFAIRLRELFIRQYIINFELDGLKNAVRGPFQTHESFLQAIQIQLKEFLHQFCQHLPELA